jgi:hypothetical protein
MSSLQYRITSFTNLSAHLLAELSELDRLRDKVREAKLAVEKSVKVNRGRGASLPSGTELERRVNPLG